MGLRPQPRENAGEFDRDIAAADNGDAPGHFAQIKCAIRDDGKFGAWNIEPGRVPAGGNDDALGGDAIAPTSSVWASISSPWPQRFGARLIEQPSVDAVQPGDFLILGGNQGGPVMAPRAVPAETVGILGGKPYSAA